MTNVFHTGRPRGSITTPTAVTNGARPVAMPRGMKDGFRKLKRIFSTYLGFVGPGILISIAYMVIYLLALCLLSSLHTQVNVNDS
jgi:hypothetical protein